MTRPTQPVQPTDFKANPPEPEQVNGFHIYDDVDRAPESHHHTLGPNDVQACAGSHSHDGRDSKLLNSSSLINSPIFVQDGAPTGATNKYLWVQTNQGSSGEDISFWVEDGDA